MEGDKGMKKLLVGGVVVASNVGETDGHAVGRKGGETGWDGNDERLE